MATELAPTIQQVAAGLNLRFAGRATWRMEHDVARDHVRVGFQCTKRTPEFMITTTAMEELDRFGSSLFVARCTNTYVAHHRLFEHAELAPILTCASCRSAVDIPPEERRQSYEFCVEQAEAWMKRAAEARPVGNW